MQCQTDLTCDHCGAAMQLRFDWTGALAPSNADSITFRPFHCPSCRKSLEILTYEAAEHLKLAKPDELSSRVKVEAPQFSTPPRERHRRRRSRHKDSALHRRFDLTRVAWIRIGLILGVTLWLAFSIIPLWAPLGSPAANPKASARQTTVAVRPLTATDVVLREALYCLPLWVGAGLAWGVLARFLVVHLSRRRSRHSQ
ncbi:MAG: hypothetical protein MUF51_02660, partial [Vicinamibacteria bacterium]|nr:hypothetical protein [Vicinamibacteria bacterium]